MSGRKIVRHRTVRDDPAAKRLLIAAKRALSTLKATGCSIRPGSALAALEAAVAKAEGRV